MMVFIDWPTGDTKDLVKGRVLVNGDGVMTLAGMIALLTGIVEARSVGCCSGMCGDCEGDAF